MGKEVVSTRVELDQQTDLLVKKMMRHELRTSKREMAAVLLTRLGRLFDEKPETIFELGIVHR